MKILVICQYYYPEPFRISDICEELVLRGHEVSVVTGVPNYPEGIIYPGYENGKRRKEVVNGVNVYRCHTIPRKKSVFYRFLNYYSYARSSTRFISSFRDEFDAVFINQLSPVMMANAGIRYGKIHHKPVILYCLDPWPVNLAAGNVSPDSVIYNHYFRVSENIYTAVDKILVSSKSFSDYLEKNFGINPTRIHYLPQYAEDLFANVPQKKQGKICDLVFAGNIGKAQKVMTIVKAAEILKDRPVRFHIVGSGVELDDLKAYAEEKQLGNITFYGRKPLEDMPAFYEMADAMLLTLEADRVISMTLPGKLQSYMAAGKPIIAAADGETKAVINEAACGFCSKAEDENELAENILRFINCEDKTVLSQNSYAFYEKHFNKKRFIECLEQHLTARVTE